MSELMRGQKGEGAEIDSPHDWQPVETDEIQPFPTRFEQCSKCDGKVMYVGSATYPTGKNPADLDMDYCPADG